MLETLITSTPTAPVEEVHPSARAALQRVVTVGWLLDSALEIPLADCRFGADAALGIVPVLGDLFATCISWYIVVESLRFRAPPALIGRMLFNIAVDVLVSALPVVGVAFDILWPANDRNAELLADYLLEEWHAEGRPPSDGPLGRSLLN